MKITKGKKASAAADETKTSKAKVEKAPKETKETKEAAPEFKYGVPDLAELMGIKPASVRVQLRNHEIKKAGKSYGWNTKAELQEIVAKMKPKSEEKDEKPAKAKGGKGAKAEAAAAAA